MQNSHRLLLSCFFYFSDFFLFFLICHVVFVHTFVLTEMTLKVWNYIHNMCFSLMAFKSTQCQETFFAYFAFFRFAMLILHVSVERTRSKVKTFENSGGPFLIRTSYKNRPSWIFRHSVQAPLIFLLRSRTIHDQKKPPWKKEMIKFAPLIF